MRRVDTIWNKGIAALCDFRIPDEFPDRVAYRRCPGHAFSLEPDRASDLIPDPRRYAGANQGDLVWVRLPWLRSFVSQVLPVLNSPVVLVTGDCDNSAPSEVMPEAKAILDSPKILHWFAQNFDGSGEGRVSGIPIGNDFHTLAVSSCWGMRVCSPLEQEKQLRAVASALAPRLQRRPKIYVDFRLRTHVSMRSLPGSKFRFFDRRQILKALSANPSCVFVERELPRLQHWLSRGDYCFVVSPHGCGLDCHRTWEALCLGHIVIVPSSSMDEVYKGLPVICLDNFDGITPAKLEHWLQQFEPMRRDLEQLTNAYWVGRIRRWKRVSA